MSARITVPGNMLNTAGRELFILSIDHLPVGRFLYMLTETANVLSIGRRLYETAGSVSRFFAPNAGIPEDPVTSSSHSTLIPFWAERLGKN